MTSNNKYGSLLGYMKKEPTDMNELKKVVRGKDMDSLLYDLLTTVSPHGKEASIVNIILGAISKKDIEAQYPAVELEMALDSLRNIRNELLANTDWCALSDVTMSDDMKTYRQKLRDITKGLDTVDKVNKVTMPTKPE